ncbi:uncharacterized protein K444DRAFT_607840 [Hyaloscypha bicolor E]|uniref:Uncharacterized protein n=1 Tax=Hyaloscypha bicolor E TaxID=1095630 RepID=A0A2J6TQP6_9HELO|nr:uncharacterized protein K444DRAFT_607840 [Hyaloscypha bicolor E]PMD65278.1 hypothetical protein K444DRAFT_607840 [Hyaloscypha bicolor E]
MAWSRHNKDLPSTDNETESTTDADTDSLFDRSNDDDDDDETDITSGANTDSLSEIDNDIDDNVLLFNNKVWYPPEHYLTIAVNLNIQRLRY